MRRLLLAFLLAGALGVPATQAGAAGARGAAPEPSIVVVDVDGLLDPVTAGLVERSLAGAEADGAALFVLTVDSSVAVDVDVDRLAERIGRARVPVVAWVKGGGAARGEPARLVAGAHVVAISGDSVLELDGREYRRAGGPVDLVAPALRDLIALVDGRRVVLAGGEELRLDLGDVIGETGEGGGDEGAGGGRKQVLPIRFRELGPLDQAQHALTSPFVALLLLVLGLCLVVFEFFAIGIGLAAAAGALALMGSFVGLAHLPVNTVSLGLLVAGVLAVSVDVQAGAPRFWATAGSALVLAGSLRLYDGPSRLDPPVAQVVLVVAGALLFLLPGLAAMIRARFSTPTIGPGGGGGDGDGEGDGGEDS